MADLVANLPCDCWTIHSHNNCFSLFRLYLFSLPFPTYSQTTIPDNVIYAMILLTGVFIKNIISTKNTNIEIPYFSLLNCKIIYSFLTNQLRAQYLIIRTILLFELNPKPIYWKFLFISWNRVNDLILRNLFNFLNSFSFCDFTNFFIKLVNLTL